MVPFFSILTPLYNGSCFFSSLKRQVIDQTFPSWEWIIVDDLSTDTSYGLYSSLESDARIRVIQRDPRISKIKHGPYAARNYALSLSSGTYVVFLDVDDIWSFDKLASDYDSIEEHSKPDILYSRTFVFVHGSSKLPVLRPIFNVLSPKIVIKLYNPFPMLSTVVRRSAIGSIAFRPINHEDYIFWYEIINSNHHLKVVLSGNVSTYYRISPYSLSGNKLIVLSWWLNCYKYMGCNWFVSLTFLFIRILLYCIEVVFMKTPFATRCPLPYDIYKD